MKIVSILGEKKKENTSKTKIFVETYSGKKTLNDWHFCEK